MTRPIALVTGASRGIGRAVAGALAADGTDLVLLATDRDRLDAAAHELRASGVEVRTLAVDLADHAALAAAIDGLGLERLDVLVNNAAIVHRGVLADTSADEFTAAFAVNVTAPAELVRLLTPALRAARGTVVMINSGAGSTPIADMPVYVAAKFALRGLTDSLRLDLGPQGVRVVTVAPGPTATRPADLDGTAGDTGKLRPEDVAGTVLHVVRHPGDVAYTSVRPPLR